MRIVGGAQLAFKLLRLRCSALWDLSLVRGRGVSPLLVLLQTLGTLLHAGRPRRRALLRPRRVRARRAPCAFACGDLQRARGLGTGPPCAAWRAVMRAQYVARAQEAFGEMQMGRWAQTIQMGGGDSDGR